MYAYAKKAVLGGFVAAAGTLVGSLLNAWRDADGLTQSEVGTAIGLAVVAGYAAGHTIFKTRNAPKPI